jgi:hypothetical protein
MPVIETNRLCIVWFLAMTQTHILLVLNVLPVVIYVAVDPPTMKLFKNLLSYSTSVGLGAPVFVPHIDTEYGHTK